MSPSESHLHKTAIGLKPNVRADVAKILNVLLADLSDLYSQTKQAHWNVRGPHFITLHKLFDMQAQVVFGHIDPLAERIAAIGGFPQGTVRAAAKSSQLKEFPTDGKNGMGYLEALIERFGVVGNAFRDAVDKTDDLGDMASSDLLTEILRALDQALWFLEAHHSE